MTTPQFVCFLRIRWDDDDADSVAPSPSVKQAPPAQPLQPAAAAPQAEQVRVSLFPIFQTLNSVWNGTDSKGGGHKHPCTDFFIWVLIIIIIVIIIIFIIIIIITIIIIIIIII